MDEKMNWGFIILIFLFFMIFGGWGNGGLFGGRGGECAGCGVVSNCQVEKQQIIDTARTQYMIENTAKQTQEQAMALANALGTKIDFYEYQNLRDQLAQERTKNVVLENRVYKEVYEDIEEDIYLCVNGEHFDEDLAKQAVSEMINAGGTTGEKWSKERTDEAARIVGITENLWDFYYVINMYYSDYNTVIGEDITMAAKLSKAFIEDVDVPEGKAYRYYKYVVKDE